MSKVWNIFKEQTVNNKPLANEALTFFWIPAEHIKTSDISYKIQEFL